MARSKRTEIELTAYDNLFETDESREEANLSKIGEIPIFEIDGFPDCSFKILMYKDMERRNDTCHCPSYVELILRTFFEEVVGRYKRQAEYIFCRYHQAGAGTL